jgi:serine/threonine protein phosphatase PrpC
MIAFDVFSDNAFKGAELKEVVDQIVYIPQTLNALNLFEVEPLATTNVMLYKGTETLEFIPTTERGSPRSLPGKDSKYLTTLHTYNLRQEDRINSHEIQNLVNENVPFDTALANADAEIDKRFRKLVRKLEYTREFHRFAALNGIVLDADGSVLRNFYTEFGIVQPAAITFNLSALSGGQLRTRVTQMVYRPMMRQLNASYTPTTRIGALCSDGFYDKLLQNPEFYKTFETQQLGAELREQKAWQSVTFAGVEWVNFRGTDDNTTIAVEDGYCRFFPIGATDVFKEYRAPGEDWREVNKLGEEFYPYIVPDPRAPDFMAFVDMYLDAHPLFACIRPDVLMRGVAT